LGVFNVSVLFSLALVVWGRNGFNKSFQSSKEIKLNEINFNKKYGRNRHTALTCCVITLFGLALGFAFYKYNLIHNFIGKTKE
jgi:hypothetical protein